jgi:hypothetical protein
MSWFKKDPPPPDPKVPRWIVQSTMPFIFAIVVGLIAFITNGFSEDLKGKANNDTVIRFLEDQKKKDDQQWQAIQQLFQQQKDDNKEINNRFEEKLYRLENKIDNNQYVNPTYEKPPLTPLEFKDYMKLLPEERAAFRKLHPAYESLPK